MSLLIALIIVIVVAAVCIWIIDQIPMEPKFKTIARVLVGLCVLLWLLSRLGVLTGL